MSTAEFRASYRTAAHDHLHPRALGVVDHLLEFSLGAKHALTSPCPVATGGCGGAPKGLLRQCCHRQSRSRLSRSSTSAPVAAFSARRREVVEPWMRNTREGHSRVPGLVPNSCTKQPQVVRTIDGGGQITCDACCYRYRNTGWKCHTPWKATPLPSFRRRLTVCGRPCDHGMGVMMAHGWHGHQVETLSVVEELRHRARICIW